MLQRGHEDGPGSVLTERQLRDLEKAREAQVPTPDVPVDAFVPPQDPEEVRRALQQIATSRQPPPPPVAQPPRAQAPQIAQAQARATPVAPLPEQPFAVPARQAPASADLAFPKEYLLVVLTTLACVAFMDNMGVRRFVDARTRAYGPFAALCARLGLAATVSVATIFVFHATV